MPAPGAETDRLLVIVADCPSVTLPGEMLVTASTVVAGLTVYTSAALMPGALLASPL